MRPVVKGFIVVLFLEGWCKVEGRLSRSYMWVRAWPESHLKRACVCVLSWTPSLDQDVHSVARAHVCVEATSVGLKGSDAIVTIQSCIIGIGRGRHTQREREQTQAYGDVVFPCTSVWVWSLSEVGYMTKCECSPTGSSTVPLCSLRNIPALPFPQFLSFTYLQSVFPLQAYTAIPWFHSMSFFSVYLCAQLFWLSE